MDHCGIPAQAGPGITEAGFDPLTALEKWVEDGLAPNTMLATKADKDGKVLWTRPLCPFPRKATYRGAGEIQGRRKLSLRVIILWPVTPDHLQPPVALERYGSRARRRRR